MGIISEAIDQWIDELDATPKYLIKDHREGFTSRKHTIAALYKHCARTDELAQWIINNEDESKYLRMNKQFDTIFEQHLKGLASSSTLQDLSKKHNIPLDKLQAQLDKGTKVEAEHTRDKETAKKIAMDHLFEVPDYYDKLEKIEPKK